MQASDFDKFREGISGVYAFYGKEVSRFALDVWWRAMAPFELNAIIEAFNRHLVNPDAGQWLPKPADIVRMLEGRSEDAAMVAWSKVDRAVRCIGTGDDVAFDDPLIHRVLHDMGGWIQLGDKGEAEWPFVAKEFSTRYRGYRMRSERPEYPRVLTGRYNAQNQVNGQRLARPRLIGDQRRCQAVLRGGVENLVAGFLNGGESAGNVMQLMRRAEEQAA